MSGVHIAASVQLKVQMYIETILVYNLYIDICIKKISTRQ